MKQKNTRLKVVFISDASIDYIKNINFYIDKYQYIVSIIIRY